MHDDIPWYAGPSSRYVTGPGEPLDRVTHLVLVDGRLVDVWSEPADGSPWQQHADRFDRERRPPAPPAPPPAPPWQSVLTWLGELCGGADAVAALSDTPLSEDGLDLPEIEDPGQRRQLETAAELLDAVAAQLLDTETSFALRRALLAVWAEEPETVASFASPAQLAGGVCWAVLKANGVLSPHGWLTQSRVREVLVVPAQLSGPGRRVERALHGLAWTSVSRHQLPVHVPDLLSLGRTDVLVSTTRKQLLRLRDRARAARDAAA